MRKSLTLFALWTTHLYPASIIYGPSLAEKIRYHDPEAVQFVQEDTFDPVNSCCCNYPFSQSPIPVFRLATLAGNTAVMEALIKRNRETLKYKSDECGEWITHLMFAVGAACMIQKYQSEYSIAHLQKSTQYILDNDPEALIECIAGMEKIKHYPASNPNSLQALQDTGRVPPTMLTLLFKEAEKLDSTNPSGNCTSRLEEIFAKKD